MNERNSWIWQAGAFSDKNRSPEVLCGQQRFEWRGTTALVQRLMRVRRELWVVVSAAGTDPRQPTEHDLTNAAVTALVVCRQREFRRFRKWLRVYLEYAGPILSEAPVDLRAIAASLKKQERTRSGLRDSSSSTPSPIVSYLLRML